MSEEKPQTPSTTHSVAEGLSTAGTVVGCVPVVGGIGQLALGGAATVAHLAGGDVGGALKEAGVTVLQAGLSEVSGGMTSDALTVMKGGKLVAKGASVLSKV